MKNTRLSHIPPFTVSAETINRIADIVAMMERFAIRMEQDDALLLRKANRIKTIQSSLAIEGNSLSENDVCDILEGRNVVAPIRQIQEVKNAIATYDLFKTLNPFSIKDLLKAHGVMMQSLLEDAGKFRQTGVGVFSNNGLEHMAPPAHLVPEHMNKLFDWLKNAKDHLLIRSCVFHYEFEFIHPFTDGNGRMGRLWQSLILSKLHPVFEHLPVENMVYSNQQNYYDAIAKSTAQGDCAPFIDFMLDEIYNTLLARKGEPLKVTEKVAEKVTENQARILELVSQNPTITQTELAQIIGISRTHIAKNIATLKAKGLMQRVGSDKGGHWKTTNEKKR